MAQPYVGEIRMFAGNFAPAGWMFCEGQLLPISENETLFNLIGTTYGGDGQIHLRAAGPARPPSDPLRATASPWPRPAGVEEVTLTGPQIPAHTHPLVGTRPTGHTPNPARQCPRPVRTSELVPRSTAERDDGPRPSISTVGGSQPHNNFQPYLCVDFIISLFGIFPSPELGARHGSVRRRDPHLPVQLRAQGLGVLRRADAAALAEHRAVLACSARHTAATARPTSRCRICRGRAPMHPGQGRGLSLHDSGRDRRARRPFPCCNRRCQRTSTPGRGRIRVPRIGAGK